MRFESERNIINNNNKNLFVIILTFHGYILGAQMNKRILLNDIMNIINYYK